MSIIRAVVALITAIVVGFGLTSVATPRALAASLTLPFDVGRSFYICQGYNGPISHTGGDRYGLDLTVNAPGSKACPESNASSGLNIHAPAGGSVGYWSATFGILCINIAGGQSIKLGHLDPSQNWANGTPITADQVVGAIAPAGTRRNNGVAHIHVGAYSGSGCPTGGSIPFASSYGTVLGGYDLPSSGTSHQYKGTVLTRNAAPPPSTGAPNYGRFLMQTGSALGLDDPTNWEFVAADMNRDGIQDLVAIIERGPTGSGRKEVHVLSGATNYTTFLLQTGLPLGLDDPNAWEFEAGDVNRDGVPDLIGIVEKGPTGTGRKEMHVLSGATNFQTFILQVGLPLGLDDPNNWEFVAGDQNRDGYMDLIGVIEIGPTGTGRKEVHVLNGATSFQSFLYQAGIPLGLDNFMNWEFQGADVNRDGAIDLVGIVERGPTGTNRREIHVLDGASGFQRFTVQQGTALGLDDPTNWEFEMGDINRDGVPDLIGILERGPTGTNRREVHVMG